MINRLSIRAAAALAVGSLPLTGCALTDAESTRDAKAAEGVVSAGQAVKLLDRYSKTNNAANKDLDPKLLSTVEGGALLERSSADYEQRSAYSDKEWAEEYRPWFFKQPADDGVHIPAKSTGASWFAVSTHTWTKKEGTSKKQAVAIFDRGEGGEWKLTATVWVDPGVADKIVRDKNGHAVPVDPGAKVGAVVAPDRLPEAVADLCATGGKEAGKVFTTSETTTWMKDTPKEENDKLRPHGRASFNLGSTEHSKVYALKTNDGGSVAIFNTPVEETASGVGFGAVINPSDAMKPYVGSKPQPTFTLRFLHQSVAYIPPRGKAELLGSEAELTGAK